MANNIDIIVNLKDRASKEFGNVQKALKGVKAGIDGLVKNVFSLKTAFVSLGAGIVANKFLETAKSFEKYQTSLETITGSAANAKKAMDWVTDFTAKTPYELDQVTEGFTKLKAYGIDPVNGTLKTLGDTASAMAKPLDQAVEMFADAVTGEFERLKEFGIRAKTQGDKVTFSWLQNGQQMQKTVQKTGDAIQKGLIEILEGRFAGAMDKQSKTFAGMWSNIQDQFTLFQKSVMDAGVFEYLKKQLAEALKKIEEWKKSGKLDEWAKKISAAVISAIESFKSFASVIIKVAEPFTPLLGILLKLSPILVTLGAAITTFSVAWIAVINPIIQVTTLIGGLSPTLAVLGTTLGTVTGLVGAFFAGWKAGEWLSTWDVFNLLPVTIGQAVQAGFSLIDQFASNVKIKYLEIKIAIKGAFGGNTAEIEAQIAKEREHIKVIQDLRNEILATKDVATAPASVALDTSLADMNLSQVNQKLDSTAQKAASPDQVNLDTQGAITSISELDSFLSGLSNKSQETGQNMEKNISDSLFNASTQMTLHVDGMEVDIKEMADKNEFLMAAFGSASERAAQQAAEAAKKAAGEADVLAEKKREMKIETLATGIESIKQQFAELTKDETKTITIVKKTVEEKSQGGIVGWGLKLARGGRLSGYGGGDRIRAMLEAGEFVVRKEAVKKYGAGLLEMINGLQFPMPDLPRRYAAGGYVAPSSGSNITVTMPVNINATGGNATDMTKLFRSEIIPQLKTALQNNTQSITTAIRKSVK
ncbi:MAG: hypothetical protein KJ737_26010 [Proteobacteria bacterium]|nr:hypothetical protein [Pseudomonadota bacterium]